MLSISFIHFEVEFLFSLPSFNSTACVKERAILVRVQDLAGQLHGKMVDLQNGGSDQYVLS